MRSLMVRRSRANACHSRRISPRCLASTETPSCGHCISCVTRDSSDIRQGRGTTVAGTPQRGAVLARAKDLVTFARKNGYRPDELIAMIEAVS